MDPTVTALVSGGSAITAGGHVKIGAASNPPLPPASDGTFDAVGGVGANTITFYGVHNASTGDTVTYQTQGQPTVSGLVPGRTYTVIVMSTTAVQLGSVFTNSDVDTTLDLIDFGLREHHLNTGDVLLYQLVNGGSAIGGLTPDTAYQVFKVDNNKIKLQPVGFTSVTDSVNASAVDNGTHKITGASGFANGNYVTYHAPGPLATFTSGQVNKTWNSGSHTWDPSTPASNSNNIFFAVDNGSGGFADIGLATGELVLYRSSGAAIGNLSSGSYYWVIRKSGQSYQLADSKCHATGAAGDCGGSAQAPVAITLNPTGISLLVTHSLTRADRAPINGLVDGHGYYVVGCPVGGCDSSGYQLSLNSGGGAIGLTHSALSIDGVAFTFNGGPHVLRTEGIDLTSTGATVQKLIFAIAPVAGPGPKNEKLDGIGQTIPFGAVSGDQNISASATGGGGGAISVSTAKSFVVAKTVVSNTVSGSITAGSIEITTDAELAGKTVSSNDSGGLISVNSAEAETDLYVDDTLTISSGAVLVAADDVLVDAHTVLVPVILASSSSGGLFAGGSGGETARADYLTKTRVDGTITAGKKATVQARTSIDGYASGTADVGGLGVSGEAYTDMHIGQGFGGRTGFTDTWGGSADTLTQIAGTVTGNKIFVKALVDKLEADREVQDPRQRLRCRLRRRDGDRGPRHHGGDAGVDREPGRGGRGGAGRGVPERRHRVALAGRVLLRRR